MLTKLNNELEFENLISKGKVLVDFYASWCGPCRMLAPVLEELATKDVDFNIIKVDVDEFNRLAAKFNVRSIPTLIKFEDGIKKDEVLGYRDEDAILNFMK